MLAPWKKGCGKPRQHIKKQRHYFADKGPSRQSYGFSSSRVQMWELDHKRRLSAKELMLWNCGVREDSWESLGLQDQTSQSWKKSTLNIHWKDWCWSWNSTTLATWFEEKSWLIGKHPDAGKDWRQEKGVTEDEMVGWHHQLNGHECEQTLGDSEGQGSLASMRLQRDRTQQLNYSSSSSSSETWLDFA